MNSDLADYTKAMHNRGLFVQCTILLDRKLQGIAELSPTVLTHELFNAKLLVVNGKFLNFIVHEQLFYNNKKELQLPTDEQLDELVTLIKEAILLSKSI